MKIHEIVPGIYMPLSSEERVMLRKLKEFGKLPCEKCTIDDLSEHELYILDVMAIKGAIKRTTDGKNIFYRPITIQPE